jgi:hypothetical protein
MKVLGGILMVTMELQILANALWFLVGIPIFLSLGVATFRGVRRVRAAAGSIGEHAPEVSPLGRRAMRAAVVAAGLMVLVAAGVAWMSSPVNAGPTGTAAAVVTMVLVLAFDAASVVLAWTFVALVRDVRAGRGIAGRDAVVAYVTVALGYSLTLGAVVVAGMSGVLALR